MFKIGENVRIKTIDELLESNLFERDNNVYVNKEFKFVILSNFAFFDNHTKILSIDEDDKEVPYFLANGIWVPEFMIESLDVKPEPEIEIIDPNDNAEEVEIDNGQPKIYINRFTGKPFGKLMMKLINIDEKVAEFSSTRFSRLRRHELVYIANILLDHGADDVAIDVMNVKELATYCYEQTLNLNV